MMRRTDWENKIEQGLEGGDPERAAKMKRDHAEVALSGGRKRERGGLASLRAMPWLLHLWESRVSACGRSKMREPEQKPLLVEMYTRLLTGAVAKSNAAALGRSICGRSGARRIRCMRGLGRGGVGEGGEQRGWVRCAGVLRWKWFGGRSEFAGLKATARCGR